MTATAVASTFASTTKASSREPSWRTAWRERPELIGFAALLIVFNAPLLTGSFWHAMIFQPQAVLGGEWWRVLVHPFVHATWYHLLLDGAAFLLLYLSLVERRLLGRLAYVVGAGVGSLLCAWWAAPAVANGGLCGLSGIAHGLMAVSAIEMMAGSQSDPVQRRLGWISFIVVVGKAAIEALSGRMFFTSLHFGLMGDPVAVSHAGGVVGGLLVMLVRLATVQGWPAHSRSWRDTAKRGPNERPNEKNVQHDGGDRQLDLVLFLDGQERQRAATEASLAEFRAHWQPPKWHIMVQ